MDWCYQVWRSVLLKIVKSDMYGRLFLSLRSLAIEQTHKQKKLTSRRSASMNEYFEIVTVPLQAIVMHSDARQDAK
jgi:hypothetical protein